MKLINDRMEEIVWENKSHNLGYDDHYSVHWYELKNTSGTTKIWHEKDYMPYENGELLVSMHHSLYVYENVKDAFDISNTYRFTTDYFATQFFMPNESLWCNKNIYLVPSNTVFMYLDQIVLRNKRQNDIFFKYHLSGYGTKHLIKVLAPNCRKIREYFDNRRSWPANVVSKEQIGWIVAETDDIKRVIDKTNY